MIEQTRSQQPATVISVEGPFDIAAASALRNRVAAVAPDGHVVVDLARARDIQDLALASLASGLVEDHRDVQFRGLSHHQERMLRYLGLGARALGLAPTATGRA
jgi:anti-anti-sigma regulatory factor